MNISYNWLKEYVNFDLTPDETAAALTSIGLETGGVEKVESVQEATGKIQENVNEQLNRLNNIKPLMNGHE